jgi:hypothetical protein
VPALTLTLTLALVPALEMEAQGRASEGIERTDADEF